MKLTSKLLLIFVPFLITALVILGSFSFFIAQNSVRDKAQDLLHFLGQKVVLTIVQQRYDLLSRSGLDGIESFAQSYQREIFAELDKLQSETNKHFHIIDTNNALVYSSVAPEERATLLASINNQTLADAGYLFREYDFTPWQWRIFITESASDIDASINRIRTISMQAIIITSICCIGLFWLIIQRLLILPMRKLQAAAQTISNNKHSVKIALHTNDELAEMGRAMESMSEAIEIGITKAEAASHAKTEFLATMSHEIRTPLNGLQGMANILSETKLNEHQQDMVHALLTSSKTLSGIINDVLDLSKIEAGKLTIEETPLNVTELAQSIELVFSHLASERHTLLQCHNEIAPEIALLTDAVRVRQIVFNLVSNAVKFTDSGQVNVTFALLDHVPSNTSARLQIVCQDDGIGIEPERQSAIFEEFNQSDSSTTRKYGGSGLGLAIVKKLLDVMHGDITLDSNPGVGSVFTLSLPVKVSKVVPVSPSNASEGHVDALQPLRILVVEDNEINAVVAKSILQKYHHKVMVCGDGVQAVAALREHSFDVVLMDIHMPNLDGVGATRQIREELQLTTLPIIGLTAEAFDDRHKQFIASGMDVIVTKPIDEPVLMAQIAALVTPV
jgi:signal transduction histidine kinase